MIYHHRINMSSCRRDIALASNKNKGYGCFVNSTYIELSAPIRELKILGDKAYSEFQALGRDFLDS